jgi:GDP-4-dehydro-6-deoxy-D-mannose reductase
VLHGDASKIEKMVGWRPEIPFEKTLEDTLQFWRERVSRS